MKKRAGRRSPRPPRAGRSAARAVDRRSRWSRLSAPSAGICGGQESAEVVVAVAPERNNSFRRRRTMARDAVIALAVRTPIGKRNGALKDWHPVDLSGHVLDGSAGAQRHRPGADRRRHLGLRQPGRRAGAERRPQRRARRRVAGVGPGHDRRPPVRLEPAGDRTSPRRASSPVSTTSRSPVASSR